MTECAAADVRVWKRNTTSKWYQGIFVAKLIGVHSFNLHHRVIVVNRNNRTKSGGHFVDVKQSIFRHLITC